MHEETKRTLPNKYSTIPKVAAAEGGGLVHEVISQTDPLDSQEGLVRRVPGERPEAQPPEPGNREGGRLGNGERKIRMPPCRPAIAATRLVAAITGCPALPATPSPGASEAATTGDCRVLEQTPKW